MNANLKQSVNKIFNPKEDWENQVPDLQQKVTKMYDVNENTYNPFLDKNGNIFNKFINYQQILDNPNVTKKAKDYITQATGLTPTPAQQKTSENLTQNAGADYQSYTKSSRVNPGFAFNADADENNLASLDVQTELPKLNTEQISKIISQHFGKSTVITPSDAEGIYNAQQQSGMSALAILGIGALESGYGTSNIAKQKNNIWGWNATNVNPTQNAKSFSQMSSGALDFANSYMKTYYNGYGAKTINSAGTGSNPSQKGYAYNNDGSISTTWASSINSIMKNFYNTAKTVAPTGTNGTDASNGVGAYTNSVGKRITNTANYNNNAAKGQCVWYVRGRATEKLGKDTGAIGNANEMWYNAKPEAKLPAAAENIKPDMIVSYQKGSGSAGQKYGHVIFIEDVVGDTVYYTEGGSGYYNNGTDGTVKTATKQGILDGVNNNGSRMGSGVIGFIDLSKY